MTLRFDPGNYARFKADIRGTPGYPLGEELRMREMVFASDALLRLPDMLALAGPARDEPLIVVMDRTMMRRGPDDLKPLLLGQLCAAGWHPEPLWLEPD